MRLIAYLPVKPFSGLYMCDLESSIAGRGLGWCDCAIHVLATGILIMARRIPRSWHEADEREDSVPNPLAVEVRHIMKWHPLVRGHRIIFD